MKNTLYRVRLFARGKSSSYQTFYARADSKLEAISACVEQLIEAGERFSSIHSCEVYG